ncbi:GAF and ANTAR domain-containing protein [Cellulomonas sp. PhB143]|uniref:GAF and ANTAR domain-containing protein n=1 Tax=Cellulomonas sp. PhB143 TaxID=2485186 RepID=UPI000F470375|nr:GAF and ANTAR domain-containing protein [Cellulomonas sp. PhB143]ROS73318.1 GAF domain-containing protein [Cellulomonas sp. PhB143]
MADDLIESEEYSLERHVARATRQLTSEPTLQDTLDRTVELAVEMIEGCDAAGISMVERAGKIDTPAASDQLARRGDELQYELGEGPCLDAIRESEMISTPDLADDPRWRTWGERAVSELGVGSMLCLQLYTSDTTHGALNLYSRERDGLRADVHPVASTLAALAAAAYENARTTDQLRSAIHTRTIIGQAQGIVMERFNVSASQAFSILSRLSQESNTKLVEVARRIADDRMLPAPTDR